MNKYLPTIIQKSVIQNILACASDGDLPVPSYSVATPMAGSFEYVATICVACHKSIFLQTVHCLKRPRVDAHEIATFYHHCQGAKRFFRNHSTVWRLFLISLTGLKFVSAFVDVHNTSQGPIQDARVVLGLVL